MPENLARFVPTPELNNGIPAAQRDLGMAALYESAESAGQSMVVEENIRKLEMSGEVGAFLLPLYRRIIDTEPRLDHVILRPFEKGDHQYEEGAPGFMVYPSYAQTEHDEVHINVGGWKEYRKALKIRDAAVKVIAGKLGIQPEEMTEEMFAAFILAHEFGHEIEMVDKGLDERAHGRLRKLQEATLPVPGKAPSELIWAFKRHPIRARQYMKDNRERLAELRISSIDELIVAQEIAYRSLPVEDYADKFAVNMLAR